MSHAILVLVHHCGIAFLDTRLQKLEKGSDLVLSKVQSLVLAQVIVISEPSLVEYLGMRWDEVSFPLEGIVNLGLRVYKSDLLL